MLKQATSMSPVDSTAVGMRGTRPVCRNSTSSGTANAIDVSATMAPMLTKNANGRSSFTSLAIVFNIRQPSRQVLSLLALPAERAPLQVARGEVPKIIQPAFSDRYHRGILREVLQTHQCLGRQIGRVMRMHTGGRK